MIRAGSRKGREGLKYYEITSIKYFNFSIGEILVSPNSLHNLSQHCVLPSTMSCLTTPASSCEHLHPKTAIAPRLSEASALCSHPQTPSRLKPGEEPESIWMSFYGPFKIALNIASIKALHNVGKSVVLKHWEGKNGVSFVQICACEELGISSWPVSHWSQGNVYVRVQVLCRIVVSSHQ